jgi:hypothetical protein
MPARNIMLPLGVTAAIAAVCGLGAWIRVGPYAADAAAEVDAEAEAGAAAGGRVRYAPVGIGVAAAPRQPGTEAASRRRGGLSSALAVPNAVKRRDEEERRRRQPPADAMLADPRAVEVSMRAGDVAAATEGAAAIARPASGDRPPSKRSGRRVIGAGAAVIARIRPVELRDATSSVWRKLPNCILGMAIDGVVHKGIHVATGAFAAIKEVLRSASDRGVTAFRRDLEVRAAVGDHPHIVAVLAVEHVAAPRGLTAPARSDAAAVAAVAVAAAAAAVAAAPAADDNDEARDDAVSPASVRFRVVMEYCCHGTLTRFLAGLSDARAVAEPLLRAYARQLLSALQALHEVPKRAGGPVVHRGVSPSNIFVSERGTLKLAGFARSRFTDSMADDDCARVSGAAHYLAPEAVRGCFSPASDIWALGATLAHVGTGRLPWTSRLPASARPDDAVELLRLIADVPTHPPEAGAAAAHHHPELPADLSPVGIDFFACCFQIDPALRGSARELLQHPWCAAASARA